MKIDIPLTGPQKTFCRTKSLYPAIIGGLGCMRGDTRIHTENGLMRICDISKSTRVLSWNERNQRFQLSLSSASFPKGRESLYQIHTTQGVFEASGHHRTFSSQGKYELVQDLKVGGTLKASPFLSRSSLESYPLLLSVDAPHYNQTDANLMAHCATEARQCGLQLLSEEENARFFPPSSNGARKLPRTCGRLSFLREDDQKGLIQGRIHRDQYCGLFYKKGCEGQVLGLEVGEEHQNSALCVGHTLHCHCKYLLSHERCECRHKEAISSSVFHSYEYPLSSTTEATIISIERKEVEEAYWDIQVMDTNNYVCESGLIHHNSGKSKGGTMRLIMLLLSDKGTNGGYYMPSYDLLKLRAMPGVQEDLEFIGLPYTINKSDYSIKIHGFGKILFRSYDRPERIIAYETAHSIVDELDTLSKEKAALVWRKVSERNRQKCKGGNTIGCVTTPDQGYSGFIYQKWYKQKQSGYEVIKAPTASNPYLPEGYIEQIRANYDPLLADMYLNGEIVNLTDKKVYHFFDRIKHHSQRTLKDNDRIHVTIDFNIGGCCSNVYVIENNRPTAVDEFISHDTYDFVNNLIKYKKHKIIVYPDASGKANKTNATESDLDIIKSAGHQVSAPNANPAVRDRINCVNAKISRNELFVNTDKCPELATALEHQGYNKNGEPEKFTEHPAIDDWCDGTGYFIHRMYPIRRPMAKAMKVSR